ncbi:hypothetical protein F5X96DRAFT_689830 [Biscogniauxia mediterranea]|nr:hypothetical protein F5X96DRAFT_689830 [Biscogniauxia mediterranea]
MGIKGIYKEIGAGKRISLTKLAIDTLEETGRPLRIAIDISIWQFQIQAARGGSNPAVRTLFYRLLRLLGLSIQPIFVFDGPNKPAFKRNKRAGRGDGVATAMAKRMIRLFGFKIHDAPGEAEAECALLQRSGIVDAVLSEDVDTIMFGCTRTLRNWSSEGTKASKTPTHVSLYDTEDLRKGMSGLDREGMVLVALMSGGDYLPEGVPGAGVKLACEAARAGFGKSLCRLKRADTSELASWKEWLIFELRHNESGFFRTRHKALTIPEDFPNMEILRYYTHPVVSPASTLDRLRQQTWDNPVDVVGLREFVQETFDWSYRIGAIKFIRVLAPALLVRKFMERGSRRDQESQDTETVEKEESELVKAITSRRAHFSTDATSELRISFIPTNIVGYDFQDEPDEVIDYGRDGLALNSDDEMENLADEEGGESAAKATSKKPFSPTETDLSWIPETVAKLGIPLMVEDWEEGQRAKAAGRSKAKASKAKSKTGGMASGAIDKFVRVTKNTTTPAAESDKAPAPSAAKPTPPARFRVPLVDPVSPAQSLLPPSLPSQEPQKIRTTRSSKAPIKSKAKSGKTARRESKPASNSNPWTIAGAQVSPRVTKSTSLFTTATKDAGPILISSSPPASPTADRHAPSMNGARDAAKFAAAAAVGRESNAASFFSSPPPSPPQKRRSRTPCETTPRERGQNPPLARDGGSATPSVPSPSGPRRRKLARTESLPPEPKKKVSTTTTSTSQRGGGRGRLARARTVAAAGSLDSDSDSDKGNGYHDGDEDDGDLPPLSTVIIGTLPGEAKTLSSSSSPFSSSLPVLPLLPQPQPLPSSSSSSSPLFLSSPNNKTLRAPPGQDHASKQSKKKQQQTTTTLILEEEEDDDEGEEGEKEEEKSSARMTKLYVPRRSMPGFFKEIDVSVDEAEALRERYARKNGDGYGDGYGATGGGRGSGRAAAVWRRSDISCIDLTGE